MHPKYTSPDAIKTTDFQRSCKMLTASLAWVPADLRDGNLHSKFVSGTGSPSTPGVFGA